MTPSTTLTKTNEFEIELPDEPSEVELVNPGTLGIFGLPKSGKTSFVLDLPDCLTVELEKNGASFKKGLSLKIPEGLNPIQSIRWLKAVIKKLIQEKKYKYVAFDTLTIVDQWCEWAGTERYMNSTSGKAFNRFNKKDHPDSPELWGQKIPYGHDDYESIHTQGEGYGYRWSRMEVLNLYEEMSNCSQICTIYIMHVAEKLTKKIKNDEEIVARSLSLTGAVKDIVARKLDAIAYLYHEDEKTMVSFNGNEEKVGGMRGASHLRGYQGPADWKKIFV